MKNYEPDWLEFERRIAILASLVAAAVDLKERDAKHRLRGVVVSLAEDNQTVPYFRTGRTMQRRYVPHLRCPEPVAEEDFDAARYVKMIRDGKLCSDLKWKAYVSGSLAFLNILKRFGGNENSFDCRIVPQSA